MLKQQENRNRTNENEVEENSSQGKGGALKQFGLSSSQTSSNKSFGRIAEAGLKLKSNSQEIFKPKGDKVSQKQSTIPQKRNELNAGLKVRQDAKKQHKQSIEKTYRRQEQEIDWTPEDVDLDFGDISSSTHISYFSRREQTPEVHIDLEEESQVKTRRFLVEPEEIQDDLASSVEEEEFEHDTTKIEYAPLKEIELPYEPDKNCIVDYTNFTGVADHSAYEIIRLSNKDVIEFTFDDVDLEYFSPKCIDDNPLTFDYYHSDEEPDLTTDESTDIPFSNYLFDVNEYLEQCI